MSNLWTYDDEGNLIPHKPENKDYYLEMINKSILMLEGAAKELTEAKHLREKIDENIDNDEEYFINQIYFNNIDSTVNQYLSNVKDLKEFHDKQSKKEILVQREALKNSFEINQVLVECIKDVWSKYNEQKDMDDDELYDEVLLIEKGVVYEVEIDIGENWIINDKTKADHIIRGSACEKWFNEHFIVV